MVNNKEMGKNTPRKDQLAIPQNSRAIILIIDKVEIRSENNKQTKHLILLKDTIHNKDLVVMNIHDSKSYIA